MKKENSHHFGVSLSLTSLCVLTLHNTRGKSLHLPSTRSKQGHPRPFLTTHGHHTACLACAPGHLTIHRMPETYSEHVEELPQASRILHGHFFLKKTEVRATSPPSNASTVSRPFVDTITTAFLRSALTQQHAHSVRFKHLMLTQLELENGSTKRRSAKDGLKNCANWTRQSYGQRWAKRPCRNGQRLEMRNILWCGLGCVPRQSCL